MSKEEDSKLEFLTPTKKQLLENIAINLIVRLCWLFKWPIARKIGAQIRYARLKAHLKLQPLADMLGIKESTLQAFELGLRVPNDAMLYNIFEVTKPRHRALFHH